MQSQLESEASQDSEALQRRKSLRIKKKNERYLIDDFLVCTECDIKFSSISKLSRHNREVHQGIKCHRCTECGRFYKRKEHRNRHLRSIHGLKKGEIDELSDQQNDSKGDDKKELKKRAKRAWPRSRAKRSESSSEESDFTDSISISPDMSPNAQRGKQSGLIAPKPQDPPNFEPALTVPQVALQPESMEFPRTPRELTAPSPFFTNGDRSFLPSLPSFAHWPLPRGGLGYLRGQNLFSAFHMPPFIRNQCMGFQIPGRGSLQSNYQTPAPVQESFNPSRPPGFYPFLDNSNVKNSGTTICQPLSNQPPSNSAPHCSPFHEKASEK